MNRAKCNVELDCLLRDTLGILDAFPALCPTLPLQSDPGQTSCESGPIQRQSRDWETIYPDSPSPIVGREITPFIGEGAEMPLESLTLPVQLSAPVKGSCDAAALKVERMGWGWGSLWADESTWSKPNDYWPNRL